MFKKKQLEIRKVFSSSSSQVVMLASSTTTMMTTTSSTSAALTTSNLNAHQLNMTDAASNTLSNPIDSVMPTPLAYSRSSSLTSLNSFDVKSVHSEVASEYSHYPCLNKNKSKRKNLEKIISDNSAEDDDKSDDDDENDDDDDDDTQEEDNGEDVAEKESKTFYHHHFQNKKANDDTQNDEDEYDDFDKLMPESPAAPADSSFVMQQRIKHKQLQMHCREKAAATMHHLPLSNETTTTTTTTAGYNFLEQNKSWQIPNTDLNAIMSKLSTLNCNANVSSKATTPNTYSHLSPQTQLVMPLQATFPNNANNNTPPVKLLSAPKFVQNMSQSAASSVPPIVAGANPPMSVTYAFMKNSQINRIPVVTANSLSPSTSTTIAISQPTSLSTTSVPSQTMTNLNHQPKFLMSSTHHYPIYNTTSINHSNPPPPPTPIIKISPLSTTATTTTIAPSKSPQAVLDEVPSVFSTETRLNHNRYVSTTTTTNNINYVGQDNNVIGISQPSSPPESVCSRMSDTSIPSIIRQDINLNKNKFQNILNKSNQSYSNNNVAQQQAPANDFKALFSKLSTNKTTQQIQQQQQPSFYQYQVHLEFI